MIGDVFHAATRGPLQCAQITSVLLSGTDGDTGMPIRCRNSQQTVACGTPGPTTCYSDLDGHFEFEVAVEGAESLLVQVRKLGFAENLRRVDIMADRCWKVGDAFLNPVNEEQPCTPTATCWLCDPSCATCPECPDWQVSTRA